MTNFPGRFAGNQKSIEVVLEANLGGKDGGLIRFPNDFRALLRDCEQP